MPDNIPGLHTLTLKQQTVLFSQLRWRRVILFLGARHTTNTTVNWEWWFTARAEVWQTCLASCLSCNKPNPSTVNTAPLRVLWKVLVKDTWAVYSFLISMLSPPSICLRRRIEETLDNNLCVKSREKLLNSSAALDAGCSWYLYGDLRWAHAELLRSQDSCFGPHVLHDHCHVHHVIASQDRLMLRGRDGVAQLQNCSEHKRYRGGGDNRGGAKRFKIQAGNNP